MEFDALLLSKLQFAFVIAFHILFPAFTIGLAAFLAVCEGMWLMIGGVTIVATTAYILRGLSLIGN